MRQIDLERQRSSFRIENTLEDHTPARDASGKAEYAPLEIQRLPIHAQSRVQGLRLKVFENIFGITGIHGVSDLDDILSSQLIRLYSRAPWRICFRRCSHGIRHAESG